MVFTNIFYSITLHTQHLAVVNPLLLFAIMLGFKL